MIKSPPVNSAIETAIQFFSLSLTLSLALFLSACTVGPDYVRPTVETPDDYKELKNWKTAEPADNRLKGKWWEIFGDTVLNELEDKIEISNQNVAEAEARFRKARAAVDAARAGYYPTVDADASFTRARRPDGKGSANTTSVFLLTGSASWEPDIWGKVRRMVEASKAEADASEADLEAIRLSMHAELAQDYFRLRVLDVERELLDSAVQAYQKSLELTKNRYAGGIVSRADVLQAETQLKTTQAQSIDIGVQRTQTEHAIAVLTGRPASLFFLPAEQVAIMLPDIPVGIPSELLERRPDIASSERRMAAANAQIGVAQSAYYPSVTLSASGGFQGSRLTNWISWPNRLWALGAAIAQTVFDGGLRRALTEEARADYDATIALYRQSVLTAFQEVEDNLAAIRILEEEAIAQEEAVRASRQSLEVALNQYKEGTVSYLNVIIAQTIKLNNERTAADILGRRMSAGVLLIKALGGGWDEPALASKQ